MEAKVEHHALVEFRPAGYKLDITEPILLMFISIGVIFLLVWAASKRAKLVPGKLQGFVEVLIDFVRISIVDEMIGPAGKPWFTFLATFFLFIFVNNLLGLIPGREPATALIGTTTAWALIVFIVYHIIGVQKQGALKYVKGLIPSGLPVWLAPFMFVLEVISHLLRPLTLALRLFANIFAGHQVLLVFAGLAVSAPWFVKIAPFSGLLIMYAFEIFVSGMQAYIFTMLTALYIGGALQTDH